MELTEAGGSRLQDAAPHEYLSSLQRRDLGAVDARPRPGERRNGAGPAGGATNQNRRRRTHSRPGHLIYGPGGGGFGNIISQLSPMAVVL